MDTQDIISDLINENPTDSEQITAEMALLDTQLTNNSVSPFQEENTNDATEPDGTTQEQTVILDAEKDVDKDIVEDLDEKITRPCMFAVNRIKTIMKCDPDMSLVSKESIFAITKATVGHIYD